MRLAPPSMPVDLHPLSYPDRCAKRNGFWDVLITDDWELVDHDLYTIRGVQGVWISISSRDSLYALPHGWADYLIIPNRMSKPDAKILHSQLLKGIVEKKKFVDLVTHACPYYDPLRLFVIDCRGSWTRKDTDIFSYCDLPSPSKIPKPLSWLVPGAHSNDKEGPLACIRKQFREKEKTLTPVK